jgi:hypothetical protein
MNVIDLEAISAAAEQIVKIARQNDTFRTSLGTNFTVPGKVVYTSGVQALGGIFFQQLMVAVMKFADFTEDNDPHGQHDFGIVTIAKEGVKIRVYWKIDLYDSVYQHGAETPADPATTRRVLTLLLPSEY